jgi:hypothetical protein
MSSEIVTDKQDSNLSSVVSSKHETSSIPPLTKEQIAEKLIVIKLKAAIDVLDKYSINVRNLILELARCMYQNKLCEESQICRRIKDSLKDKIKEGKISKKWIEECLPQEYKRKYTKSEVSSLSNQNGRLQMQQNNDSHLIEHICSNPEESDSKIVTSGSTDNSQNISQWDDDKYEQLILENNELREILRQQQAFLRADQVIKRETQFYIPKEKYDDLRLAMDNSKDLVLVVFDTTGKLKCVKPDTSRDKLENI